MIECKPTKRINYSYFIAISVNFMSILAGVGFSWSSPCVPKLSGKSDPEHNPLEQPADIQQIAWITSLHNLGCIIAPLLCGFVTAKLGKKKTLLIFAVPQLISNVILIFASEVVHFYAARFLMGVGTGGATTLIQVYVVEVVPSSHRGRACSFTNWMVTLAQDFVFVLGPYVTIKTLALISLVPSVAFFVVFGLFVPESPYYFVGRSELKEAEAILVKTRRTDNVNEELEKIVKYLNDEKNVKFSLKTMLGSKGVRKSFALSVGLTIFQQFAGINCVFAYQQSILAESESSLPADKSVMVVSLIQIIPMILITKLVDTWGRRKLIMLSYAGEFFALVIFGTYFFLKSSGVDLGSVFWLPLLCLIVYIFSFKLGSGPLTSTISIELFPQKYGYILTCVTAFLLHLLMFLITYVFPSIWTILGLEVAFWGFAVVAIVAIVFIYFLIPETSGKTLAEIQKVLLA